MLLFAIAAIGFIAAENAKKNIVEQADRDLKIATKAIEMFKVDMTSVVNLAVDSEIKKKLEKLAEESDTAIRFQVKQQKHSNLKYPRKSPACVRLCKRLIMKQQWQKSLKSVICLMKEIGFAR